MKTLNINKIKYFILNFCMHYITVVQFVYQLLQNKKAYVKLKIKN